MSEPLDPASNRRFVAVAAGCAALLAGLVYLNALRNPFVYDDHRVIVENASIRDLWDIRAVLVHDIKRPIVNLSYALDTALWGDGPLGYHATSVWFHVLNVLLVFWVSLVVSADRNRQKGQQYVAAGVDPAVVALAAASLFAVHPLMTQAVGYISARSEVAYATSFLLAFLAGRRWMLQGGRRWWLACFGLWGLAMLTKETAAMLSFVLIAYDWLVLDSDWAARRRRLLRLELPLFVLTLVAGAGRVAVLQVLEYGDRPEGRLALTAANAFWRYLLLVVAPQDQSIFHVPPTIDDPLSPRAVTAVLGLAGFVFCAWWLRRLHSVIALGLLWFVLLLVPSSLLFTLGRGEAVAEHRAYLATAGLFLSFGSAFALAWTRYTRRRWVLAAAALASLLALSARTVIRNAVWHDPVLLASEAKHRAPNHWLPRLLLAEALRHEGRCREAVGEYRAAIAMNPREEFAYPKLALCLTLDGRRHEAAEVVRQLRALRPESAEALALLGLLALVDGRLDQARQHFDDVLALDTENSQAGRMVAFMSGTLPPAEHRRVCEELQAFSGGEAALRQCLVDTQP